MTKVLKPRSIGSGSGIDSTDSDDEEEEAERQLAIKREEMLTKLRNMQIDLNDPQQMESLAKLVTVLPLVVASGAIAATAAPQMMPLAFYFAHSHLAGASVATQTFGGLSAMKATIPYAVSMAVGPSPL